MNPWTSTRRKMLIAPVAIAVATHLPRPARAQTDGCDVLQAMIGLTQEAQANADVWAALITPIDIEERKRRITDFEAAFALAIENETDARIGQMVAYANAVGTIALFGAGLFISSPYVLVASVTFSGAMMVTDSLLGPSTPEGLVVSLSTSRLSDVLGEVKGDTAIVNTRAGQIVGLAGKLVGAYVVYSAMTGHSSAYDKFKAMTAARVEIEESLALAREGLDEMLDQTKAADMRRACMADLEEQMAGDPCIPVLNPPD